MALIVLVMLVLSLVGILTDRSNNVLKKIWCYIAAAGSIIVSVACTVIFCNRRAARRDTAADNNNESVSERAQSTVNRAQQAADRISEIIAEVKKSE